MTDTAKPIGIAVRDLADVGRPPNRLLRNLQAKLALSPMIATVLLVFVGCTIWTVVFSLTNSRTLPTPDFARDFAGFGQYERLFAARRWKISITNLAVFASLSVFFMFVVGFLLAVFMDQKVRFENTFRTIFLYPFALSFIVTGVVWAWALNPAFGLQKSVRDLGWTSFSFDWVANTRISARVNCATDCVA